MRWPASDGPTFTQFFAPKAYANGWRLGTQIKLYRKVIEEMRAERQLAPLANWPMKTFEAFVYYALVRVAGEDPSFLQFTEAQVRVLVQRSGYIELELSRVPEAA